MGLKGPVLECFLPKERQEARGVSKADAVGVGAAGLP